ncbi:MAG: hypothetical protein ABIF12_03225 [bacterium]
MSYTKNKMLLLAFASLSFLNNSYSGPFDENGDDLFDPKETEIPTVRIIEQPLEKPQIQFIKGDLVVTFGGKVKIEYDTYFNPVYLNSNAPDDFGFFKQTVDLTIDSVFGKQKYGHNALESYLRLRSKNKWGVVGAYKSTTSTEVKLSDISLGEHDHRASRPNPWFTDAWLQFSLNSVLNSQDEKIHYIKVGWFPFQLGRGVAFGPFYATVYEALGLFSYYADASAPGISINGEIFKDKLWYDLYYSKFEDNTSSISDVMSTVNSQRVGRRSSPYRGEGKDDELWAAKLKIRPFDEDKAGRLDLEPYVYFNEASDQKVEIASDTKTQLGAYGIEARYKKNNFKVGGEVAFNYGQEKLYSIDRNKIQSVNLRTTGDIPQNNADFVDEASNARGAGLLYKGYSHVLINGGDLNGQSAPVIDNSRDAAYNSANITKAAGDFYGPAGQPNILVNRSTRIRSEYRNKFMGWMGILDARYRVNNELKFSAEGGYASGDNDPHIEEVNKNYDGFVGLHELYMGKRVFAPLVLGERYIARPLGLVAGQREVDGFRAKVNGTFSDLKYIGLGATWQPELIVKNRFKVNPNLMFFWKDDHSYKYVIDANNPDNNQVSDTEKARSFMGAEFSVIFNYELLKDLTLGGIVSLFVPGSYYKDIKGVPLKNDFYRDVLTADLRNNIDPLNYRLSDDCSFYGVLSLEYKF